MMRAHMVRLACLLALLGACRSVTTDYRYPEDLYHPNYVKRSKAVREFAETKDQNVMPRAFSLLLDVEPHIRAVAYETIREMGGGEDFGYRPYLSEDVRIGIVARWEAWWSSRHKADDA